MATQTEIINLAMTHISQKPIESISEGTPQANAAKKIYTLLLKEVLRSNHWPFAKVIKPLVLLTDHSPLIWAYGYTYPSKCIILRKVYNEGTDDISIGEEFEVVFDPENAIRVIETDLGSAYGEYTYYVEDATLYDAAFITAFSHRLAADLAISLNADKRLSQAQIVIFNGLISEAKRMSTEEKRKPRKQTSSYVSDRA